VLAVAWSIALCVIIVRTGVLPRWLGVSGVVISVIYLLAQGDVIATALPGFPVWDAAGLIGSTGWGLWVAALGVTVFLGAGRFGATVVAVPDGVRNEVGTRTADRARRDGRAEHDDRA
jgi:hypothetical protein